MEKQRFREYVREAYHRSFFGFAGESQRDARRLICNCIVNWENTFNGGLPQSKCTLGLTEKLVKEFFGIDDISEV